MSLMSLQGAINLAVRKNARPTAFHFVGVADACEIAFEVNTVTQMESHTGERLEVGSLTLGKSGTLSMTLKDWSLQNLALVLYGNQVEIATGTVTAEAIPDDVVAGDRIRTDNPFIDSVVVDNSGTPLVEGTDYEVESPNAGIIKFLTAPPAGVTLAYSYAKRSALGIFTQQAPERWFLLDGINTENGERLTLELFKVKFNPVENLGLLHNEGYGELSVTAAVLADLDQPVNSELGRFGRIAMKDES